MYLDPLSLGIGSLCGMVASAPLFIIIHMRVTRALRRAVHAPREMCGGCGAYLTKQEIEECKGAQCERFKIPAFVEKFSD